MFKIKLNPLKENKFILKTQYFFQKLLKALLILIYVYL